MNYIEIFDNFFKQQKNIDICFEIKFWDLATKKYGTEYGNKKFTLVFANEKTLKRVMFEGSLGFGESYMDGSLEIEGDIEEYLKLRHKFVYPKPTWKSALSKMIYLVTVPLTRRKQISYHYDMGNNFFSLFLDKATMSYSAGFFSNTLDINQAQINKFELICSWLNLPSNSEILDLGCGWGGFSIYAANFSKYNIDGLTLSKKQFEYDKSLVENQDLGTKINFEYKDFIKEVPKKEYDGIVMIESIEHVSKNNLENFMKEVYHNLKPAAPIYIQFTGRYKSKRVDRFTLKYVFPGGHLHSKQEFINASMKAGFTVNKFEDHTEDYKKTIANWISKIEENQEFIEKIQGKSFFRLWKLWTHGAKVNFEIGEMSLFRVLLRK